MNNILNITNGDSAVNVMEQAQIPGDFLPWRDVLHEGPVPANMSLNTLSELRAQFIADQGWGNAEAIKNSFMERDKRLESYMQYDRVILWFEHDLYDQLQILQILDWFSENPPDATELSIICTEQYLGLASPEQIKQLSKFEESITDQHLKISKQAWAAFRAASPDEWQQLIKEDLTALPFLEGAVVRLLEEYPNCKNGLSRTAHKALEIISLGEKKPGRIFGSYQESEERRFLGDTSFWAILYQFLESTPPLIELPPENQLTLPTSPDQELSITSVGKEVLTGRRNWLEIHDINQWIGGVHLTPNNLWCWDSDSSATKRMIQR
ncbi:hypothetical protein [Kaarinaea lacus]